MAKKWYPQKDYVYLSVAAYCLKMLGSVAFVLVSIYHYHSGDTFLFFQIAEDLRNHLAVDVWETLQLLVCPYGELNQMNFNPIEKYNYFYDRESNWIFGRIIFFFNLLGMGSYLASSILLGSVSFLGLWIGFRAICKKYESARRLLFISFFAIPSALMWGSGILKDSIVVGTIGLLIASFYYLFIYKKKLLLYGVLMLCSMVVFVFLKPILFITMVPIMLVFGCFHLTKSFQIYRKILTRILIIGVVAVCGWIMNQQLFGENSKYRADNLLTTLKGYQTFHSMEVFSKGQNGYTFENMEYTVVGVVKKIPSSIVVTWFRPFVWEVNKLPMLLGALEIFVFLFYLTLMIVLLRLAVFKIIFKQEDIAMFMVFGLLFSIVVGLTSYNFGALSRYKIPAILFLMIGISLAIQFSEKPTNKNRLLHYLLVKS